MYLVKKEDINKRICDVEKGATNKQTYAEFIFESELEFGLEHMKLEKLNEKGINDYIDFLDNLWTK